MVLGGLKEIGGHKILLLSMPRGVWGKWYGKDGLINCLDYGIKLRGKGVGIKKIFNTRNFHIEKTLQFD